MKTWFHRLFLAAIFTLTFAHVQVGVSVPNGLTSAQISVSVFDAAYANSCVANNPAGNWGTAGTWATCGGVAPTSADTCSITGTGTITVESAVAGTDVCGTTDFTGFTGTLSMVASKELDIYGSLTLVAGMTYSPAASSILKFKNTSGTAAFTTAGKILGNVTVDGVGGTMQFADNPSWAASSSLMTVTNGTLDFNGKTVTNLLLSASGTNVRGITCGAATLNINTASATGWDITDPTNLTFSCASATINYANANSNGRIFAGGGLTYGTFTDTALTTGTLDITGADQFTTLTLSQGAGVGGSYQFGGNITVSGTCTFNSNSVLNRVYLTSDTKGTARTISCATVTTNGGDFQDITGAGAGSWNLSATTHGGGNCGGTSGITFNTPKTNWVKNGGANVNFSSATIWFTADGGSTAITPAYPLPQDTNRVATAWTGASKTLTIDASAVRIGALDFTSAANTPGLVFTTAASYFGSITLVSGMTVSGTGQMTFEGRGSQTVTTAGITMTPGMTVNSPGGTWTQQDNLTNNRAGATSQFTRGTWATGSNNLTFSGSAQTITVNGGTLTSAGTLSTTGASGTGIVLSSGDINMPLGIWSGTVSGTPPTFSGGTAEIGTLTITGNALTITGTTVQIGIGGAAFATPLTISSTGSLAPTTGNKITSVSSAAIAVSAAASGGGSCSFGDAGQWRDWNEANDNVRYRRAM